MQSFISKLPIYPQLSSVVEALTQQDQLVLVAQPGAGKSTAVPLYLLEHLALQGKKIVMLEPRRLAVKSIANFLASQLNEPVGQTVGYQIRNEQKASAQTRLEIVTEGVLTARIQQDPELHNIGLIIFDEFHERSIHADLGITLCKDIRSAFNESLKLLVMSATIESQVISDYLDQAPVLQSEGRCFPVQTNYLPKPVTINHPRDWLPQFIKLIQQALKSTDGDILAFLPGQAEIKQTIESLEQHLDINSTVVLPLYGALKAEQQQQALVLDEQGRQKVVLATNIAETSLTIENVSAVVDSGLERVSTYDVSSGMNRLMTQRISQASADQREGRAGRVQAGHCFRMWTETQQQSLTSHSVPEIMSSDLSSLRLSLAQWGVKKETELDWLTMPPKAHYDASTELLTQLGLLQDLTLTEKGKKSVALNIEPRYASLLVSIEGEDDTIKSLTCDLVAVLSENHFFYSREDADIVSRILALQAFRTNRKQACQSYPIKYAVAEQAIKLAKRLAQKMGLYSAYEHSLLELQNHTGRLVALAYPDRLAKSRSSTAQTATKYLMSNGKGAVLQEGNRLKHAEWLAIADLDGQRGEGRIFLAAEVSAEAIQQALGFKEVAHYAYNEKSHRIEGKLQTKLGAIVVKESKLDKPDAEQLKACLRKLLVDSKLAILPWRAETEKWLNRVNWLCDVAADQCVDWPDVSAKGLLDSMDEWLLPYMQDIDSIQALQKLDVDSLLKARFDYNTLQEIEVQAPEFYQTPTGKKVRVDYQIGQLPKVSVILQELFGELSSPRLAWGKVHIAFELLSPARRPIQITSDLGQFWQASYFEVAKEMRGRYPKHRWPEQPLLERPGKSLKSKN